MTYLEKVQRLQSGETFITKEKGNSMLPVIASGQPFKLTPLKWGDAEVGNIVFCKIGRRYYTHKVVAKSGMRGLQIGNMRGRINGWTKQVYGKVIEIL